MSFWSLALKSLLNRRFSVLLTILSISVGVSLLLGIERLRLTTQKGFESTISQTDLVVGARGSPLQILLYSVFHIGNPLNNIRYESFERYSKNKNVKWAVPISLGDSHRGYRVVGTSKNFFENIKVGQKKSLQIKNGGRVIDKLFDVVLGSEVARRLNYSLGKKIHLAHGVGAAETFVHEKTPFEVVGILESTGTPLDRSVFVSLQAIEAIHEGWDTGAPTGTIPSQDEMLNREWRPKAITAFFVGLQSRMAVFNVQREINDDTEEPLTALLPGLTLRDLWNSLGKAEVAFRIISLFVLISNLLGLLLVLLSSMNERRREMAIYRSVGAGAFFMGKLLLFEAFLLSAAGIFAGLTLLSTVFMLFANPLELSLGFPVPVLALSTSECAYLAIILVSALLIACVPAYISKKYSLSDGLSVKQ